MVHVKPVVLSDEARKDLEHNHRVHKSAAVRQRCQIILLKSKDRSAEDIASILDCSSNKVHGWVNRYKAEGFQGLLTKPGRGRKAILNKEKDGPALLECVRQHRQNVKAAKAAFEQSGGPVVCAESLRLFLKALVTPISGFEDE